MQNRMFAAPVRRSPQPSRSMIMVVLAALLLVVISPAASAADVFRYKISDRYAYALGSSVQGCEVHNIGLDVSTKSLYTGTPGPLVNLSDYQYNTCTGASTHAYGQTTTPSTLSISGSLTSGRVVATIPVTIYNWSPETGETYTTGTRNVDMTFTSVGDATRSASMYKQGQPGVYQTVARYSGTARPAVATGNLPLPLDGAIVKVSSASMTITTG